MYISAIRVLTICFLLQGVALGEDGYQDMDGDGILDCFDSDVDGDGIPNVVDPYPWYVGTPPPLRDYDGTRIPNDIDVDGDRIPNDQDPDSDGDGIPDIMEYFDSDWDGDGIPNYIDPYPWGEPDFDEPLLNGPGASYYRAFERWLKEFWGL